jgi:hypothetical protein
MGGSRELGDYTLVAHLLEAAALWVRIQTSLKNTEWTTSTHSSPPKKYAVKKEEAPFVLYKLKKL